MLSVAKVSLALISLLFFGGFVRDTIEPAPGQGSNPAQGPEYTSDGQMKLPELYREWVFLASEFDMSNNKAAVLAGHHTFDNVFVNPEAYKEFEKTGTWPDKTMLVLEVRGAGENSKIPWAHYQGPLTGVTVHVKDNKLFPGGWAFFRFGDAKTGAKIPESANCYSCHKEHAAVDTTFVQFYPTLLQIATKKGTLTAGYLRDAAPEAKQPL
jgi:hypothetical protein